MESKEMSPAGKEFARIHCSARMHCVAACLLEDTAYGDYIAEKAGVAPFTKLCVTSDGMVLAELRGDLGFNMVVCNLDDLKRNVYGLAATAGRDAGAALLEAYERFMTSGNNHSYPPNITFEDVTAEVLTDTEYFLFAIKGADGLRLITTKMVPKDGAPMHHFVADAYYQRDQETSFNIYIQEEQGNMDIPDANVVLYDSMLSAVNMDIPPQHLLEVRGFAIDAESFR